MISFETYISQKTSKYKLKNLQTGDKVKYIGKESGFYTAISDQGFPRQCVLIPNNTYTFLELREVHGVLCVKIKIEGYYILAHLEDFIKI